MGSFLSCSTSKIKKNSYFDESSFILKIENEEEIIPESVTLKIHVCGIDKDDNRIKNIFNNNNFNNENLKNEGDLEIHQNKIYFIIKSYSKELNNSTFDEICNCIKNDRDTIKINIKQNCILYFEDNPNEYKLKDILLKKIEDLGIIYRPRMIFVTKKKYKFNMNDNRYITNIIWKDDSKELFEQIMRTIWNIDCYFNEKQKEMINYDPDNIFKGIEKNLSDYSLNIFLTGLSRAGKSSFINLMTGKLSALESNDKESVTSKLTEYFIISNEITQKSEEYITIKLVDSPGIVYNFNNQIQNQDIVINSIKEAFEDNSIDQIDIILFFLIEGNSLESALDILKILNDKNYPVVFVINKSIENEENGENKEITSILSFLRGNKLNNLLNKNNLIPCNLKSSRLPFFGMKNIWNRISDIFKEKNPIFDNEDLESNLNNLLGVNVGKIEEETILNDKKEKYEQINDILFKNRIFLKMKEKKKIFEKSLKMTNKCYTTINNLIKANFIEEVENLKIKYLFFAILVIEIGKNFGYNNEQIKYKFERLKDYFQKDFINNYQIKTDKKNKKEKKYNKDKKNKNKKKVNVNDKKESNENEKEAESQKIIDNLKKRKKSIYSKINKIVEDKSIIKIIAKDFKSLEEEDNLTLFSKPDYLEILAKKTKDFFEKELENDGFIPFYLKYYYIYNNCFKFINNLSFKENWEKNEPEYIYVGENIDENIDDNNNNKISIKNENKINEIKMCYENKNINDSINDYKINKEIEEKPINNIKIELENKILNTDNEHNKKNDLINNNEIKDKKEEITNNND